MDSPSGTVPERAPDWFLVATEACGGGTPDLGLFLEVSGFIGPDGGGVASSGPLRGPQAWLVRPGGARRQGLWLPRDPSPVSFSSQYF